MMPMEIRLYRATRGDEDLGVYRYEEQAWDKVAATLKFFGGITSFLGWSDKAKATMRARGCDVVPIVLKEVV